MGIKRLSFIAMVCVLLALCLPALAAQDLTISGGTPGTDYTYTDDGVLTILSSTALTVKGKSGVTSSDNRIIVKPGAGKTANVTFHNVTLGPNDDYSVVSLESGTLNLTVLGTNKLLSPTSNTDANGSLRETFRVPSGTSVILGAYNTSTECSLSVYGRGVAAAMGASAYGNITFNSGTYYVENTFTFGGAAIGGSAFYSSSSSSTAHGVITVNGGSVKAVSGSWGGAAVGAAYDSTKGGTIIVNGGLFEAEGMVGAGVSERSSYNTSGGTYTQNGGVATIKQLNASTAVIEDGTLNLEHAYKLTVNGGSVTSNSGIERLTMNAGKLDIDISRSTNRVGLGGSGSGRTYCNQIVINGGEVTVNASMPAVGAESDSEDDASGTIQFNGGTLRAYSELYAGIGSEDNSHNVKLVVNPGVAKKITVEAGSSFSSLATLDVVTAATTYDNAVLTADRHAWVLTTSDADVHTHAACGVRPANCTHDTAHTGITYTPWDGASQLTFDNSKSEYYVCLTADATVDTPIFVNGGKTLHLCLNGHSLASSYNDNDLGVIEVTEGGKLILCDCQSSANAKITHTSGAKGRGVTNDGTFEMYSGHIAGNSTISGSSSYYGAGVHNTGSFSMYGGSITGNTTSSAGAGVYTRGTMNLYGGEISGNYGSAMGGGVCVYAEGNTATSFTMTGGVITNNSSQQGGGVFVDRNNYDSDVTDFTMTGGEISGNTAKAGGGVFVYCSAAIINGGSVSGNTAYVAGSAPGTWNGEGGGVYVNTGSLSLQSGSITGNKAVWGAGVYSASSTTTLSGGSIANNLAQEKGGGVWHSGSSALTLSGSTISGNTLRNTVASGYTASGVYGAGVYNKGSFTMSSGTISGNKDARRGGGVYNDTSASFTMTGGTISLNEADEYGGGVIAGSSMSISGAPTIKANTTTEGWASNVYLAANQLITVTGTLSGAESIGVSVQNTPTAANPVPYLQRSGSSVMQSDLDATYADMAERAKLDTSIDASVYGKFIRNSDGVFGPALPVYDLTLENAKLSDGSTGGSFNEGDSLTLTPDLPENTVFTGWEVVSGSLTLTDEEKQTESLTFSMPAGALSIKANYTNATVTITAKTARFSSNGVIRVTDEEDAQTQTFEADYGAEVTLTAVPDKGYYAENWKKTGDNTVLDADETYTFTATEDVELTVDIVPYEYSYNIMVSPARSGAAKDSFYDSATGMYTYGSTGNLMAVPAEGYSFVRWAVTQGEGTFDDATAAETEFTIGTGNVEITAYFAPEHKHAICGESVEGSSCGLTNHSGHASNVTFLPWDGTTELDLESGEHFYYLMDDVTTDNAIKVWSDATLHLCLNGKTLTSGADNAIEISSDCAFTLCDCIGEDENTWGQITRKAGTYGRGIFSYGDIEIYGGHITGHDLTGNTSNAYSENEGAGILCSNNASLTLYNGAITYNKARMEGGGVWMYNTGTSAAGDFIMHNGLISHNSAQDDGGGVIAHGSHFVLNGGYITYNTAGTNGGGISNCGRVTINGGGISENTAEEIGGGICSMWSAQDDTCTVTMNGGYVARNTAGVSAGGMNSGDGLFIGGNAVVRNNKVNGVHNNIQLRAGEMITITADLTGRSGSSIEALGVTVASEPTASAPVPYLRRASGSVTQDDLDHTVADAVLNDAAKAELYGKRINADNNGEFAPKTYALTLENATLSDGSTSGSFTKGESITVTAVVPDEYQLTGWTRSDGETITGADESITITMPGSELTVTAVVEPVSYEIVYDLDGGVLPSGEENPLSYTAGDLPITLVNPVYEGYVFTGWTGDTLSGPTTSVTIEEGTTGALSFTATWIKAHKHLSCGDSSCTDSHGHTADVAYSPLTLSSSGVTTLASGAYYLTANTTAAGKIEIPAGETVYLCLNGYTLTADHESEVIAAAGTLVLCDCNGSGEGKGVITHTSGKYGRGVTAAYPNGSLIMYGGTISGNRLKGGSSHGAGALAGGSITMHGGVITDNTFTGSNHGQGSGIYVSTNGSLTMTGGSVTENTNEYGVVVNGGRVTLSGSATIRDNTVFYASSGNMPCNLYLADSSVISLAGQLTGGAGSIGVVSTSTKPAVYMQAAAAYNGGVIDDTSFAATVSDTALCSTRLVDSKHKAELYEPAQLTLSASPEEGGAAEMTANNGKKRSDKEPKYPTVPVTMTQTAKGDDLTVTATANAGYTFDGWYAVAADGSGTEQKIENAEAVYTFTLNLDTALRAKFLRDIQVSVQTEGGGSVTGLKETGVYHPGETLSLTAAPQTGYAFDGWYAVGADTEAGEQLLSKELTYEQTIGEADVSLLARFTAITYAITYDLAGGSLPEGQTNPETYTIETESFTLVNPVKEGYAFIGWSLDAPAEGDGDQAEPALMTEVTIEQGSTGDRAYTAHFEAVDYTITYELDGGTVDGTNPAGYNTNSEPITLINPAKVGYTFLGWTEGDGEELMTTVTIPTGSTGDKVFTAHYEVITYAISYDLAGGALPEGQINPETYTIETETFTLVSPAKEGFTFLGWITEENGTPQLTVAITKGTTGDLAFTAVYADTVYDIAATADPAEGGTITGAGRYTHGATVTLTAVPAEGWRFVCWTEADTLEASGTVSEDPVYTFTALQARTLSAVFSRLRPPVIIEQPQSASVFSGETAAFSVRVQSDLPVTYRWQIDRGDGLGFVDLGCTDPTYTTSPVKPENTGYLYRCIVENADGSITSLTAVLTVNVKPDLPDTGDTSNLLLLVLVAILSLGGAALLMKRRRNS
ncbi:MAG: InlB B-repeat-containing protein [Clostridia bacterium]|nr:InlB B-repeat-containing protein [Clostridia bacterium]